MLSQNFTNFPPAVHRVAFSSLQTRAPKNTRFANVVPVTKLTHHTPKIVTQYSQANSETRVQETSVGDAPLRTNGVGPCVAVGLKGRTGVITMIHLDSDVLKKENGVQEILNEAKRKVGDNIESSFIFGGCDESGQQLILQVREEIDTPPENIRTTSPTGSPFQRMPGGDNVIDVVFDPDTFKAYALGVNDRVLDHVVLDKGTSPVVRSRADLFPDFC